MIGLVLIHMNTSVHVRMQVQHCVRQMKGIRFIICKPVSIRLLREHLIEQTQRTALTGQNSDAGRYADTVVNDSKHVDIIF